MVSEHGEVVLGSPHPSYPEKPFFAALRSGRGGSRGVRGRFAAPWPGGQRCAGAEVAEGAVGWWVPVGRGGLTPRFNPRREGRGPAHGALALVPTRFRGT